MSELKALEGEIVGIFRDSLKIAVPASDTDLLATGLLDSLGFVDLLFRLEQRFALQIALESLDTENFRTVANLAAFVAAQQLIV